MTAQLTGVTSAEIVTLHTQNINGDGQPHGDVPFGFLTADADASRLVGKPDQTLVQGQLNQPVTSANFREDLNADGRIKTPDVNLVRPTKATVSPDRASITIAAGGRAHSTASDLRGERALSNFAGSARGAVPGYGLVRSMIFRNTALAGMALFLVALLW